MHYNTEKNDHNLPHDPFKALVSPRPIGWIGTRNNEGTNNLAPYSYFNAISDKPYFIMFASTGFKDSIKNIEETKVFTCSLATEKLFDKMNYSSANTKYGQDEFELSGLTPKDGYFVNAPYVSESPSALECELWKVIDLPGSDRSNLSGSYVVFGHVKGIYIDDEYIKHGLFDTRKAKPLGRLGYMDYGIIDDSNMFSKKRPQMDKDGKIIKE